MRKFNELHMRIHHYHYSIKSTMSLGTLECECKHYCDLTFYHFNYALLNLWLKFYIILIVGGQEENNG